MILLTYCGPELLTNGGPKSTEKNETQAVVIDLVATLGFYCANNRKNQVRSISIYSFVVIGVLIISNVSHVHRIA